MMQKLKNDALWCKSAKNLAIYFIYEASINLWCDLTTLSECLLVHISTMWKVLHVGLSKYFGKNFTSVNICVGRHACWSHECVSWCLKQGEGNDSGFDRIMCFYHLHHSIDDKIEESQSRPMQINIYCASSVLVHQSNKAAFQHILFLRQWLP